MRINISIDGVLRNLIDKIEYHFIDDYINSEETNENNFLYEYIKPDSNIDIKKFFKFQSEEEFNNFLYFERSLEIYGHAKSSYKNVFLDLNKFIYENKEHEVYLVGLDEYGKSKSATLFFLSKNGCLSDNIRFIKSENLEKEWELCDLWITDSGLIFEKKPNEKKVIKFKTPLNEHFNGDDNIENLNEIKL